MLTAPDESSADVAYRKLSQMLSGGELVPGQRLSQSRLGRQLGCSPMPVVQAIVDHDADSAEYLMKRHIQGGYAEVQRILAAQAPQPRRTRRARRAGTES